MDTAPTPVPTTTAAPAPAEVLVIKPAATPSVTVPTGTIIPQLAAGQTAWQIPGGHTVVVEIKQQAVTTPTGNELAGGAYVALRVRAWKADPATGRPVGDSRGKPLEIPAKVHTVLQSALAEGTADLPNTLVQHTVDALQRAGVWLAVKQQMDALPQV